MILLSFKTTINFLTYTGLSLSIQTYPKLSTASISVPLSYHNLLNKNQGVLSVVPQPVVEDEDVEDYTAGTNTEHPEHKFSHLKLMLWCPAHENYDTTINCFISHSSFHGQ